MTIRNLSVLAEQAPEPLIVVLEVGGEEVEVRNPASLRHRVGLVFMPWLARPWRMMENRAGPHSAAQWEGFGPPFADLALATEAMEGFNAMVRSRVFRIREVDPERKRSRVREVA